MRPSRGAVAIQFVARLLASPKRVVGGEGSDEEPTVADHAIDAYVSLLRVLRR